RAGEGLEPASATRVRETRAGRWMVVRLSHGTYVTYPACSIVWRAQRMLSTSVASRGGPGVARSRESGQAWSPEVSMIDRARGGGPVVSRRVLLLGGASAVLLGACGQPGSRSTMTPPPTSASHTESPTPATGEPSGTPTPSGSPTPSAQPTSPPTESPPPVPVRAPARHVSDVLPGAPANAVALTFDDGPHPVWSPRILGLLARYGIPATFFMIGKSVQAHPDLARRTLAEAHAVGNHTYDHPLPFTVLSRARMDAEIGDTQQAIAGATGYTPRL